MRIHTLRPAEGAVTPAKRLGRGTGSGLGKTSGKGHKGQWARSGGGVRPGFEGGTMPLTRRLPKRGFYNKFQKTYAVVNLSVFERFEDNAVVTPELLLDGLGQQQIQRRTQGVGRRSVKQAFDRPCAQIFGFRKGSNRKSGR